MLKKISFKFGVGTSRLECRPGVVTIFVGPNNSGKSLALAELHQLIQKSDASPRGKIIRRVKAVLPRERALRTQFLKAIAEDLFPLSKMVPAGSSSSPPQPKLPGEPGQAQALEQAQELGQFLGLFITSLGLAELVKQKKVNLKKLFPAQAEKPTDFPTNDQVLGFFKELAKEHQRDEPGVLIQQLINKGAVRLSRYLNLLAPFTISLGGTTRLGLVKRTSPPRWREKDDNLLVNLLKHSSRLEVLRDIVYSELQRYPVVDTTSDRHTVLKLAKKHPGHYERSTTPESLRYFDKARPVEEFSDGVKAFIGLLAAVLSQDYRIMLIDEPEAFLHPPLARRLGTELCRLARKHGAQVFASTHSADFLMGCVQTGNAVSIIRLTYKNRNPTARELSSDKLREVMRSPLLRSTGVLGALFHEGAVVCESDSDRAFYQEINERLLAMKKGHRSCAFLNAQNKQTLNRIVGPLREMGIPAAAIVDLDVISKGDELSRLLDAAQVGKSFKEAMRATKDRFFQCFLSKASTEDEAKKQMKLQGLHMLSQSEQRELKMLFIDPLAQHGIFVVPTGELESWLPQLTQGLGRSDKARWLTQVFERMGDDPESPSYAHPQPGDVWSFIDGVASWIASPQSGLHPEG